MFLASSNGTGRDACVRLVEGMIITSHCNSFPERSINQMVCHSHKFSYKVLIVIFMKVQVCGI